MGFLSKLLVALLLNGAALWAAGHYVKGFSLSGDMATLAGLAIVLTLLNMFIRPILKLILSPIIILTLGLGILVVNGLIIYILDRLSPALRIETLSALFFGTLIVSLANSVYHWAIRQK